MLKDKEQQLKLKLKNIIKEFGYDNNTKQFVMDEFKSRNLSSLRAAWVFSENLVLDKIMDSKADLANVTKNTTDFVKNNRGLTAKPILAEAIKDNYDDLDSAMQRDEIANWIVEFTNYLMGIYSDEFIVNPYEVKKTSYINNLNMFYGYIALSAALKDNKDWKEILKQKIESIDFSIDNPMWHKIGIIKENKIGKPTKNKLYKLFKEV